MSDRYSSAVIVRFQGGLTEFLRSTLYQPVTQLDPPPSWTCRFDEAELLSGSGPVLRSLASQYGGIAVVNYGSMFEQQL